MAKGELTLQPRTDPVPAIHYDGSNMFAVSDFVSKHQGCRPDISKYPVLTLTTREGQKPIHPGDWLVKELTGDFRAYGPSLLAMAFEVAE